MSEDMKSRPVQFWRFLPLFAAVALFALFAVMMLSDRDPKEVKSALIGRDVPVFALEGLFDGAGGLTTEDLKTVGGGKPVVVNFFASWCVPCRAEHDNLTKLAQDYGVTLVGIAYKDKPEASRAFLAELGNPFTVTAKDERGRTAIDWGVSGVPESFVVDGEGRITYRHWGPVVGNGLEEKLLPALDAAGQH